MTRGRKPNLSRRAARESGALTFTSLVPCICGCDQCYTSSAACVECSIARGRDRYVNHREQIVAQDAARYQRRKLGL